MINIGFNLLHKPIEFTHKLVFDEHLNNQLCNYSSHEIIDALNYSPLLCLTQVVGHIEPNTSLIYSKGLYYATLCIYYDIFPVYTDVNIISQSMCAGLKIPLITSEVDFK